MCVHLQSLISFSVGILPYPDVEEYAVDVPFKARTNRLTSHGYLDTSSTNFRSPPRVGVDVLPPPFPSIFLPPLVFVVDPTLTSNDLADDASFLIDRLIHPELVPNEISEIPTKEYAMNFALEINREYYCKADLDSATAEYVNDLMEHITKAKELLTNENDCNTEDSVSKRSIILARNLLSICSSIRDNLKSLGLMLGQDGHHCDAAAQLDCLVSDLQPFI